MSDIKRYTQGGIGMIYALDGEWVEYAAYVDLKRQLAEAKAEIKTLQNYAVNVTERGTVTDEKIVNALREVADCKLFDAHDPTDCTEEIHETVWSLIQDARAALAGYEQKSTGGGR